MIGRLAQFNLALILAFGLSVQASSAGDATSKARAIQAAHSEAVVWIEGVLKMQISAQGQTQSRDQEVEALATLIDADGIAVVPKSALNPSSMLSQLMQSSGMAMSGILTDVKMIMADGTEIAAEVILEDDVLDISVLAPSKTGDGDETRKFKHIDLNEPESTEILDQIVILARLPKYMNRQEAVTLHRISSIIQRPRTFYTAGGLESVGTPAFDLEGNLVGVTVLRTPPSITMSQLGEDSMSIVILPTEDIVELHQQALEVLESRD